MKTASPSSADIETPLHDYVVEQLNAHKGSWPRICRDIRMPYGTLKKIAMRIVKDPGVSHIERLAKYFRDKEQQAVSSSQVAHDARISP